MSATFLSADDLRELTKHKRSDAQVRVLRFMGIEHKIRPDGSLAVLWSHVNAQMGGEKPAQRQKVAAPDWGAIQNAQTSKPGK